MAFSNLRALFIIIATAATLHANGVTQIETSEQAAQALRPVAGEFAFAVFAAGIIGTGLLAVPVLAGSAAYAVAEMMRWPEGLDRRPNEAKAFYATIAVATIGSVALSFTPLNPIRALYWSAVINGILAVPLMTIMVMMAANKRVMGRLTAPWWMVLAGGFAVLIMALATIAFFFL
jgi:Mn2+/Fe2+ NRAMP family transporter